MIINLSSFCDSFGAFVLRHLAIVIIQSPGIAWNLNDFNVILLDKH